jgi:hypothetical protein
MLRLFFHLKKMDLKRSIFLTTMAEREGFEPSVRGYRTPDFESGTFDHSATSPELVLRFTKTFT